MLSQFRFAGPADGSTFLRVFDESQKPNESNRKQQLPNMSDTNDDSTTLLLRLRAEGLFNLGWPTEKSVDWMRQHGSEFPVQLQEAILKERGPGEVFLLAQMALMKLLFSTPMGFSEDKGMDSVLDGGSLLFDFRPGLSVPGNGFDCEIDTPEQVETALRFFPFVLTLPDTGFVHGKLVEQYAPFWLSACAKSLPFVPLIYKLVAEMESIYSRIDMAKFACAVVAYEPDHGDEEYDKQLDEAAHASIDGLIDDYLVYRDTRFESFHICWLALRTPTARARTVIPYLIRWDPRILEGYDGLHTGPPSMGQPPLLWGFIDNLRILSKEETLERLRIVFGLGMVHYPERLGFFFHTQWRKFALLDHCETVFAHACCHLGKKRVRKMVNQVLWEASQHCPFMAEASADGDISSEATIFLSRVANRAKLEGRNSKEKKP